MAIRWSLNWRLTCFTAFFLPILVSLGFWQLSRADEKRTLLRDWEQHQLRPAVNIVKLDDLQLRPHQKFRLTATFSAQKYWLLEARIYRGQAGYEVFMPAFLDSGEWLLVNRGWVPANPDRRILPRIDTPRFAQALWGEVRLATKTALINEQNNPVLRWPHRVLEINPPLMSEQLGERLSPIVVALASDHPDAFVVQSTPVNMPPEKHQAYAVQWFLMALVLSLLWLFASTNLWSRLRLGV